MKQIILYIFAVSTLLYSCGSDISKESNTTGIGGSYARFIATQNFLYVADLTHLQTYSIIDAKLPTKIHTQKVTEDVESIFKFKNKLFVGSQSGMFVYTIQEDGIPKLTSSVGYDFPIRSCDPVVADDKYAYVTLSSREFDGGSCGDRMGLNELKIFDISDIDTPTEIARYQMNNPKGVGIDGTTLFICDDNAGLKIYNTEDPQNIKQLAIFDYIKAYDVIPLDGLLLCVGAKNVYQFDYSNPQDTIIEISRIPIQS